jgi:N-acetylmuramoyl-L-alanine amidase
MTARLVLSMLVVLVAAQVQDPEHPQISVSSQDFTKSVSTSIEVLSRSGFEEGLESPGLGSSSSEEFENRIKEIRAASPLQEISRGERGVAYDVILQPGHYGRSTGRLGTAGQFVSERALVAYIAHVAASSLQSDGDSVLVISADNYLRPTSRGSNFNGLRAKVFLAIHAEGSESPCSAHASLGYPSNASVMSMHAVGWSLASALGYRYKDFAQDNYTANESKYYMFGQVQADRLTGLLEIGELTCPRSEKQLITSSNFIGRNIAYALNYIVKTPTE